MSSNHGYLYILPSRINYRKLDNTLLLVDYFSQCNDNNIPQILKKLKGFDNLCKKIAYNLYEFNIIPHYGVVVKDRCQVLNFWAYEKLIQLLTDSSRDDLPSIRAEFGNLWNKFQKKEECTFDIPAHDEENFKNLKIFYDYANDYADVQGKAKNHGFTCTKEYKEYIEKGNEIYNQITRECTNPSSKIYCTYVQEIMKHYKDNTLSKQDCTVISTELKSEQQEQYAEAEALGYVPRGAFSYGSASLMGHSYSENADELSPSYSTVSMAIAFPIFGILFILFIFYKFTPLGSLLRERFLRRVMFRLNEEEVETHELLEHTYDPLNMNAENSNHHIRYQLSSFS
ncbi:PIR protein [Plasmodium ovale]|uniref:PIR protein n=1 Tax=Plasmodium ovale TaxID=36330 RepID=A0A1C3KJP2_PLAOA|nr:PIR protein [Plasmodium ovale]